MFFVKDQKNSREEKIEQQLLSESNLNLTSSRFQEGTLLDNFNLKQYGLPSGQQSGTQSRGQLQSKRNSRFESNKDRRKEHTYDD